MIDEDTMAALPLSNVRILDMTRVLAGPLATQMLGDLGAEVIKIERPNVGDDARIYGGPYFKDADGNPTRENAFFLSANRNKKSVTLNIASPEGQEIVRELAKHVDVVLENYKVGDLKRYGLDQERLRAINPRLIYCSITGYGQEGPYSKRPGYDAIFQGMSGLMSVTGLPDGVPGGGPMKVGPSIADVLTSLNVAAGILGALYNRDANGGTGQYLDIALLDSTIAALSHYAQIYLVAGEAPIRRGTQGNGGMPASMFPTSDGAIMVTAGNDVQYNRLCDAIGHPELKEDERFCTNSVRVTNRDELTRVFDSIFAEKPKSHWLDILDKADIPSGPIYNLDEVFEDPQVKHRGIKVKVEHALGDEVSLIRSPIRMSETPLDRYDSPPLLGQHTDLVLEELLGYDEARRAILRDAGTI